MSEVIRVKQPNRNNAQAVARRRATKARKAYELIELARLAGAPKKKIVLSIVKQTGLTVHDARAAYAAAQAKRKP